VTLLPTGNKTMAKKVCLDLDTLEKVLDEESFGLAFRLYKEGLQFVFRNKNAYSQFAFYPPEKCLNHRIAICRDKFLHSENETLAALAHEIGHYRFRKEFGLYRSKAKFYVLKEEIAAWKFAQNEVVFNTEMLRIGRRCLSTYNLSALEAIEGFQQADLVGLFDTRKILLRDFYSYSYNHMENFYGCY
jgi:hypothetical protein